MEFFKSSATVNVVVVIECSKLMEVRCCPDSISDDNQILRSLSLQGLRNKTAPYL